MINNSKPTSHAYQRENQRKRWINKWLIRWISKHTYTIFSILKICHSNRANGLIQSDGGDSEKSWDNIFHSYTTFWYSWVGGWVGGTFVLYHLSLSPALFLWSEANRLRRGDCHSTTNSIPLYTAAISCCALNSPTKRFFFSPFLSYVIYITYDCNGPTSGGTVLYRKSNKNKVKQLLFRSVDGLK